jgi:hypothetical protein
MGGTKKMKEVMRKALVSIILVIFALCFMGADGCDGKKQTADVQQARQSEQSMAEAQRRVGMPNILNFQQRNLMKMIFELCDKENLVTYAYLKSDYQGKLIFIGKAIGFGVPFSAQFTNPMKVVDPDDIPGHHYTSSEGTPVVLPQQDPNGLFMPKSSSATWLMMIDPETKEPRPVYIEPEIVVSPFPLPDSILIK